MRNALLVALAAACVPDDVEPADSGWTRDPALNVTLISEAGTDASHETGEPCMHCHQPDGEGPGLFTAAGSVYRSDGTPADGGVIQLAIAGGEVVAELPVDTLGNFYTTADLDLPDVPVTPMVVDPSGSVVNVMPWPTESASCNQCHTPVRRVVMP